MKLIFFGPQGSGKGTQAKIISDKLGLPHISAGDLLRDTTGEIKDEIDRIINAGNLVPPEMIFRLVKLRTEQDDCKKGFILDGYPRDLKQAEYLDEVMKIDKVIEIHISDEEAIKRISSRLNCSKCGSVFNIITNPPKNGNVCDRCGSELFQRKDDKPDAIKRRLEIYHRDTRPIFERYEYIKINGEQSIPKVTEDILKELKKD